MPDPVLILGGGLAGLHLARRLRERGETVVVLEARDRPGGLCRTVRRGAWAWDIGPHAFYSRDPGVMARYRELPLRLSEHSRRVRICHRDGSGEVREVSYPFENGLADLPWSERLECVRGYLASAGRRDGGFRNLDDWIDRGLGAGIARLFMRPYNEKIWAVPLDQVSMALVKGKIEPEPAWKVVRNALVKGTVGRAYQARFLYPEGGAGAITDAVAAGLGPSLRVGWELARLERGPDGWTAVSSSGERQRAGRVVSTIPIPRLLAALGGDWESRFGGRFLHNDTFIAAVCLKEGRRPPRFAS
ncbi:MAG: FAD-dependent oxidoreductase, partial [Elusimicrobia bacterium]|nr:FAD-dependent oxidoreductase [Elusimicrobiota bacterium]